MKMLWRVIFILCLALSADVCAQQEWVWRYHFPLAKDAEMVSRKIVRVHKSDVPHFSQLIFSWNGLRSSKGYFSFFVQVRDARTKQWGEWHHALDWGQGVQRSFARAVAGISSYAHVRLEMNGGRLADAFRVRVEGMHGSDCTMLKSITVTAANYHQFNEEDLRSIKKNMVSVQIAKVPPMAQFALNHPDNYRLCSSTSVAMLASFLDGRRHDPCLVAQKVYDSGLDAYGSWPFNVAHAHELCRGKFSFQVTRLSSFHDLNKRLLQKMPVVVSVRGVLPGALKPFPQGHLLLVVGVDKNTQTVLCFDPGRKDDDQVPSGYPIGSFVRAWEASRRLAYIAEPLENVQRAERVIKRNYY